MIWVARFGQHFGGGIRTQRCEMLAKITMTLLCTAGIAFYARFLWRYGRTATLIRAVIGYAYASTLAKGL